MIDEEDRAMLGKVEEIQARKLLETIEKEQRIMLVSELKRVADEREILAKGRGPTR